MHQPIIQQYSQHPGQQYYHPQYQQQCQHYTVQNQQDTPTYWNRPSTDPNYYDQMFNSQTRGPYTDQEHRRNGNGDAVNYHLFAPKYENYQDSNGYQDTWRPQVSHRKVQLESTASKRGDDRVMFPARTAPKPNERNNRQPEYISPFQSKEQQIDHFNRGIDSLHLPEDMQRPVATRDVIKSKAEEEMRYGNKTNTRVSKKLDNESIYDRQLTDNAKPYVTSGSFEDMFY